MPRALILPFLALAALASGRALPAEPEPIEITVRAGYHPDRVVVAADTPVHLRFLRQEYSGCTAEVVFPTLSRRYTLPPHEPVDVDLGVLPVGEVPFHCGMRMRHGVIVVEAR